MVDRVLESLVASKNEAADEVLLDGMRLGTVAEQALILEAILRRASMRSLLGVVDLYNQLDQRLQRKVLERVGALHHALREAGRSDLTQRRLMAMQIIAHAKQGKLCYVLSENLRHADEQVSKTAVSALTSLARWVHRGVRQLQENFEQMTAEERFALTRQLIENRGEIEQAVVRALDVHRGNRQAELTDAAALLCDAAGSTAMTILSTARHRGQGVLVRRVQQTPTDAESVPAFLLAASKTQLRSGFGKSFAKIDDTRVIDAVLRRTHWLADAGMRPALQQVLTGSFVQLESVDYLAQNQPPMRGAMIARWAAYSGIAPLAKDGVVTQVMPHAAGSPAAKAHLIRSIQIRSQEAKELSSGSWSSVPPPVAVLQKFATDSDESIARLAVREMLRYRSSQTESVLLALLPQVGESVRRLIGRAVGRSSFEGYWQRFDGMAVEVRRTAGRAILKLLPDTLDRVRRKLGLGEPDLVVKALQMSQELGLLNELRATILPLCTSVHAKVRSKAVMLLSEFPPQVAHVLAEKAMADQDARVRANAIEVMEQRPDERFVPILSARAREGSNRERANAIKALHQMRVSTATEHLISMLRDSRSEHRISAMWVFRRMALWSVLNEVARLAKEDGEPRVRRYAGAVLQSIAMERRNANPKAA